MSTPRVKKSPRNALSPRPLRAGKSPRLPPSMSSNFGPTPPGMELRAVQEGSGSDVSDIARRAAERRSDKKEKGMSQQRAAQAEAQAKSYAASSEVNLIAARAADRSAARKEKQQQPQPSSAPSVYFEPVVVETFTSPAELRAIAARAEARKQEKMNQTTAPEELGGGKYANYLPPEPVSAEVSLIAQRAGVCPSPCSSCICVRPAERLPDTCDDACATTLQHDRLLRVRVSSLPLEAERKVSKSQSASAPVADLPSRPPPIDDYYTPPSELNDIAARAAVRKEKKQQPPLHAEPPEPLESSYIAPSELNAIAARAAARKEKKQLPPLSSPAGAPDPDLEQTYTMSTAELNAIAARAAARKEKKQLPPLTSHPAGPEPAEPRYIVPAELDAIAARAAARKEKKQTSD